MNTRTLHRGLAAACKVAGRARGFGFHGVHTPADRDVFRAIFDGGRVVEFSGKEVRLARSLEALVLGRLQAMYDGDGPGDDA